CSSASRLAAPPVPMISREENAWPAITKGSSICVSTSLGGAEHLEPGACVQAGGGPGAAGDPLAVEGHGDALATGRVAEPVQQPGHGLAGIDLGRLAVGDHGHGTPPIRSRPPPPPPRRTAP